MSQLKSQAIAAEIKRLREADRGYNNLVNEGGEGYEREDQRLPALRAEQAVALNAEFAAEWSLEALESRRATWNAEINAMAQTNGGTCPGRAVQALIDRLGYGINEISRAKRLHGVA